MIISDISDVHIKKDKDEASVLFHQFLQHDNVKNSDIILLMGDIFDLMCGDHKEYLDDFKKTFELIELLTKNKKIYYFEGNHDVHLEKLLKRRFPINVECIKGNKIIKTNHFTLRVSHGDEYDILNAQYHRWMNFLYGPLGSYLANNFISYYFLNEAGIRASKLSKKRGKKYFDRENTKKDFRRGVEEYTLTERYDYILGGHSHVKDEYKCSNGCIYLNNGYALDSKTFIFLDELGHRFISLD